MSYDIVASCALFLSLSPVIKPAPAPTTPPIAAPHGPKLAPVAAPAIALFATELPTLGTSGKVSPD